MRYADMRDAILVAPPSNLGIASDLAEQHIDAFDFGIAHTLEYAVSDGLPTIVFRIFDFDPVAVRPNVGEGVRME